MIPAFRIAQPPSRPEALTGPAALALFRTADQIETKGRPGYARLTAPIKGESFLLTLHAAKNKATGEVWTLATYRSRTLPGHVRRLVITPDGKPFMLCPADDKNPARAMRMHSKYTAHLWRVAEEGRAGR